jgi:hypothetical protein
MLKLRSARVVRAGSTDQAEQSLTVELDGARREAVAQLALVGPVCEGDQVIVNVEARDLGLGSGGFDIVHANLTRGLSGEGIPGAHVMKLNYTSLQHAVHPIEDDNVTVPLSRPVAVLALHGQLAPVAWAFARQAPGLRVGYIQTAGGALVAGHSRVAAQLRAEGLLAGHISAGAAFGAELEAISTAGALQHALTALDWDAAICGPGPGIVGSASILGHGGMSALESAHNALALGCPVVLVARMSSADSRGRHRGLSHHSQTVLDLLLEPVTVALPAGVRSPVGGELAMGLRAVFAADERPAPTARLRLGGARPARMARHDWRRLPVDLVGYASSGLPAETMGRSLAADPLFFASALAGGAALGALVGESSDPEDAP